MMKGLRKGFYQPLVPELLRRHWRIIACALALFLPPLLFLPVWSLKLAGCFLVVELVVLAVLDGYYGFLYDRLLLPLGMAGILLEVFRILPYGVEEALASATAAGGSFLLLRILSSGGMGWGDVKFAAVLGLWLGAEGTLTAVFLAVLAGGLTALFMLFKGRDRESEIPFGPFLAVGAYASYLWGSCLWQWYWGMLL